MDGNGRWAERRGLAVAEGHREGTKALRRTVEAAIDLGVETLAVYAFSTEKWGRPAGEVDSLMGSFGQTIGGAPRGRGRLADGHLRRDDRARAARSRTPGRADTVHWPAGPCARDLARADDAPGRRDGVERADEPLDRVRLRRPRGARRGGAAAGGVGRRAGRDRRGPAAREPLRAGAARPGPADQDERRAADLELPALAARLLGARVPRPSLAGLRPARARARARGVRAATPALRRAMSSFWSRILVAVVGLPVVLYVVWLGGGWLFGLATIAATLALHELFWIARPLRPLVLAGYAGALLALLGAWLGGPVWMTGGFMTTLALAFLLKGISQTRQSVTVAVGATVLGAAWVGLGLAHVLLLRAIPPAKDGRLAIFAVLLAVFASDAVAYFVGRLIGRHRLAPTISPGKTWEGLAAGTVVAVLVPFFAFYNSDFLDVWRSLVLGAVIAVAAPLGDLFESAVKRDLDVKDSGRLLAGHGGMLDRLDSHLFAAVASYYAILALT